MRARHFLAIAVGTITVIAVVWFIASFFVLKDENPRSSGLIAPPAMARAA